MKLIDLSKERDVGISCMFLEMGPFRVLVDGGLHPKRVGVESTPDFSLIEGEGLDYILLTHCHLDHLGGVPIILRKNVGARILTSVASAILAPRMLRNSYQVMKRQREEDNVMEYPLYSRGDIDLVEKALMPMVFGESRVLEKGGERLEVTFYSAGHIAGAAGCLLKYRHRTVFITGDVLFEEQCTLPGASFPVGPFDMLIMETTRGVTPRSVDVTRGSEIDRLMGMVNRTIGGGGSCLIPVFALGRMQELMGVFHEARGRGELRECPIFCSGLGLDLIDYFEMIAKKAGGVRFRKGMVGQLGIRALKQGFEAGVDVEQKGIYLLSSGMLVPHTPSYMAAAAMVSHPRNSICFVGYCDPDTPGGRLLGARHDEEFVFDVLSYVGRVRAHVERFDLTGHAERDELLEFAMTVDPKTIVLTHGDADAREWFENTLGEKVLGARVINPVPGRSYIV